jgi:cytoskeletal protein CcmA (bactofilin family)
MGTTGGVIRGKGGVMGTTGGVIRGDLRLCVIVDSGSVDVTFLVAQTMQVLASEIIKVKLSF